MDYSECFDLNRQQVDRLRRALANVDRTAREVTVQYAPASRRLIVTAPDSGQQWRIGPRGGHW